MATRSPGIAVDGDMMLPIRALMILTLLTLAACEARVSPPKVEFEPAKVTIGGSGGDFCPPGQAKKGRC